MDTINPHHYKHGGMEAIEAMEAALTPEELRGYLKGSIIKYLWRERHKGGDESLAKARWYLNRLLKKFDTNAEMDADDAILPAAFAAQTADRKLGRDLYEAEMRMWSEYQRALDEGMRRRAKAHLEASDGAD